MDIEHIFCQVVHYELAENFEEKFDLYNQAIFFYFEKGSLLFQKLAVQLLSE